MTGVGSHDRRKPMKIIVRMAIGATLTAGAPAWARAHHSHAMFDATQELTITGKVKTFIFANPHVYLFVDVKDAAGSLTTWQIEMSTVRNMMARGITATTFRDDDTITVRFNPLRSGSSGGSYTGVIDASGREYK
jgi:Family of unknown function (DUF6152)